MHHRYAKDGVVCVSLSVDEPGNKEKALKFLRQQKAVMANYLLEEEVEFWQNALKVIGPPAVLVYDREGRLAKKFESDDPDKPYNHGDVEKFVKGLLEKK
jgi:hypothetical protein